MRCNKKSGVKEERAARHRHRRHGSVRVDLPWEHEPVLRRRANLAVSDRAGGSVQSLAVPLRGSSRQIRLVKLLNRSAATSK